MPLFSKNKKNEVDTTQTSHIITTGGNIDDIVLSLVQHANDSDSSVRDTISTSLADIGFQQPDLVLSTCNDFLVKNQRADKSHRVILLTIEQLVLEEKKFEIDAQSLGSELVSTALIELTKDKEVVPDWQGAASSVLVSLGEILANEITDELLKRFEPGTIPHYFIMKTLADYVSTNSVEVVPRLKEILSRVLPVLGAIKHNNIIWVFAAGLGKFSEAILNYVANIDKAEDKSLTVTSFSSDIFPAFEVIFSRWLKSGEKKVRLASIQSLGTMCGVLERDRFEAQVITLIPAILNLYKKEKPVDHLPITQGLCSVLEVGIKDGSPVLEPMLTVILSTLHPLVCAPVDQMSNSSLKNHNELLRCVELVGRGFPETLITFLLTKLEQKDARIKIGALDIVKHLVTRLVGNELADKKGLLVSGVKPLVSTEVDLKVKKALSQVVIAMASHDYLSLEGGESLVEFVVSCCALQDQPEVPNAKKPKVVDPEATTVPEVRNICDNILNLMTTTIPEMIPVLWPYLFETLVPLKFAGATSIVCKSIHLIAQQKREEEADDYLIDFDRAVNLPKPQEIISRLLVLLNSPHNSGQGIQILHMLQSVGPILHPSICDMWDSTLPKLVDYLESKPAGKDWEQSTWEDLVSRLLSETIKIANDDEWCMGLGESLGQHLEFYNSDPSLKRIAYKHLGVVLQKSNHKEFIKSKLQIMFASVNHANEQEREGCAQGFGYCSNTHLDIVLERISECMKGTPAPVKKKSGLFGFGGGSSGGSKGASGNSKNTIFLAFGYVAAYANPQIITSRLEAQILNVMKPQITNLKTLPEKIAVLTTFNLIAKSCHPDHTQSKFIFKQRDELLSSIFQYISSPEIDNRVRGLAAEACANLVKLEPPLPLELEERVLNSILDFFKLEPSEGDPEKKKEDENIFENVKDLLSSILYSQPTIETLIRLFVHLEKWTPQPHTHYREKSLDSVLYLLEKSLEIVSVNLIDPVFKDLGAAIALMIPRCTDPIVKIRSTAIQGIEQLLFLNYLLQNKVTIEEAILPDELQPFADLKEKIEIAEINKQFSVVHELSQLLANLVKGEEMPLLLVAALNGLTDSQVSSTSGTCVVLNGIIKIRGEELADTVPEIIEGILKAMPGITNEQTMNGTLHGIRSLAHHHLLPVVDQLLADPLPHSPHLIKALQVIAKGEGLVLDLINHLMDIINNGQLYDEIPDPKNKSNNVKQPTANPMSATCALGELMQIDEMKEVALENYPQIISSLFLRFGTANGNLTKQFTISSGPSMDPKAKPSEKTFIENPIDEAIASFKQFVTCTKDNKLKNSLEENSEVLKGPNFTEGITKITATLCESHPDQMRGIFKFVLTYLKGNYPGQRIVAATIFSEFINQSKEDGELLDKLVNCLLSSLIDPVIKIYALQGLGNIVSTGEELTNKYAPTILDALVSSIDDINDIIAMESMNGLSKVFEIVEVARVAPILVNICHRIRPAFEKQNNEIRAASIRLFGTLWRFGSGVSADSFYEQIHNNLPSLIVHTNDECEEVSTASKAALQKIGPLFRAEEIEQYLSERIDPDRMLDYEEFLNDISKLLISHFPERMNYYIMTNVDYFKSEWPIIRGNGAAFTGYSLGNLPIEKRKNINLNPTIITKALIALLQEKNSIVRRKASEAMALLHTY